MPADEQLLHPPFSPGPQWWALALGLLLAAVTLLVLAHVLGRLARRGESEFTVADLRAKTLADIDAVAVAHADGRLTGGDAALQLGTLVREFVGQAGDDDADFMTARQLREAASADPRLGLAAGFADEVQRAGFAVGAAVDVPGLGTRAREVVTAWL